MADYYGDDGIHSPPGYGQEPQHRRVGRATLAGTLVALALIGGFVFAATRGEGGRSPSAVPPSPAPSPSTYPLTHEQLEAMGAAYAQAIHEGDTEKAAFIVASAEGITGCDIGGWHGLEEPGDASKPAVRQFIREDAHKRGWDVAFAQFRGTWRIVTQDCGGGL